MRWWWWVVVVLMLVVILSRGKGKGVAHKIALAIAAAEGFFNASSKAKVNNNPGNLTVDLTGTGVGRDGMFVRYVSPEDGWAALEHQILLMFSGSKIYGPEMTIAQIAERYTTTQQAEWARNVARALGVSTSTKLRDIV